METAILRIIERSVHEKKVVFIGFGNMKFLMTLMYTFEKSDRARRQIEVH